MQDKVSNCCGAEILSPDSNYHGKCSACKENCVGEYEELNICGVDFSESFRQLDGLIKQAHELKEKYAR